MNKNIYSPALLDQDQINLNSSKAEIWVHTDPKNPSNEEDLKRLDDKYSRQK